MKKILLSLVLLSLVIMPFLAFAQDMPPEGKLTTPEAILDLLNQILSWIWMAFLTIAVVFLLIAGFTFLTASGDADKVGKARKMLMYSLIGIAVAVGSRGLIALITGIIT